MQERDKFVLKSKYQPTGDQPKAIKELVESIRAGHKEQTLLGVTGSGKTFTMANVIAELNRPTLVLAHNKTLAAQLCNEFLRKVSGRRGRNVTAVQKCVNVNVFDAVALCHFEQAVKMRVMAVYAAR